MTTQEASEDLNAVVDYLLKLRGSPQVHLLGWSWGTQYSGMFVMAHPEKVAKYVSYAQMHVNSPDLAKRRPRLEAFRKTPYVTIPEAGWKPRFASLTPAAANEPAVVCCRSPVAMLSLRRIGIPARGRFRLGVIPSRLAATASASGLTSRTELSPGPARS